MTYLKIDKLKGVEGIYDQYDYLEERREALSTLAVKVTEETLINK